MRQVDPGQALTRIQTLDERLSESTAPRRCSLQLAGLFSMVALALAIIGVYGVVAGPVAQRVPEIGVRHALGATGSHVMRLIIGQRMWIVLLGVPLGTAGD